MTQSSHSCCPAYDPCPHHLSAQDAAANMDRARAADGVDREAVDLALDQRGISRRAFWLPAREPPCSCAAERPLPSPERRHACSDASRPGS
jgi:hypothetical protein